MGDSLRAECIVGDKNCHSQSIPISDLGPQFQNAFNRTCEGVENGKQSLCCDPASANANNTFTDDRGSLRYGISTYDAQGELLSIETCNGCGPAPTPSCLQDKCPKAVPLTNMEFCKIMSGVDRDNPPARSETIFTDFGPNCQESCQVADARSSATAEQKKRDDAATAALAASQNETELAEADLSEAKGNLDNANERVKTLEEAGIVTRIFSWPPDVKELIKKAEEVITEGFSTLRNNISPTMILALVLLFLLLLNKKM